ncbi:MAG: helix-turn-helix transcriptional regulator [Clostridia bacterium]|nr:helix-turn-helix transcriptional regulator [Clostridia bacterium]
MSLSSLEIGENLKRLRKINGLNQGDVANALNIDRTTYTKYEKGRTPSLEMLRKLTLIFDVSLAELLGEGEYAEKIRIASEDSEPKLRDLYLSPEEKQLIMRFRLCDDSDKRKIMDEVIDLAIKDEK